MASAIEDVEGLPGRDLMDQLGEKIGTIKALYAVDGDNDPMWVTVEASTGLTSQRTLFIPIARMKEEDDQIRVPYSTKHVQDSPEVDSTDELSAEDDRMLRDYYAIDHADTELRTDNESYAARVPDAEGDLRKI
jgi:PRC-barrel domain